MIITNISLNGQNFDFVKMVEYGLKAPSGHNTQPWKFKLRENTIEVYPNLSKELTVVDYNHRELYISLGCAVENICIAANELGYNYETEILKQDSLFFIRIKLEKGNVYKNSLFAQIDKRQTNRSVYNSQTISADIIDKIKLLEFDSSISTYFYEKGQGSFEILTEQILKGNKILFSNEEFKNELLDWIRFNCKHIQKEKDGLGYNVLGVPSLPKYLGKFIVKSFLNPKTQNKSEKEKLNSASHLVLITTKENSVENWIMTGIALERFFLKCTELGIAVAFSNQPCEVETLAYELRNKIAINNDYPMLLMRIGYSKPMPYSVRKGLKELMIE